MNNFKEYVFNHKYHLFAGIMVIIIAVIILVASNTHGNTDFDYNEGDDTTDYATEYTTYYEDTTETTTVSLAVKCHYNADGKLYGEKGKSKKRYIDNGNELYSYYTYYDKNDDIFCKSLFSVETCEIIMNNDADVAEATSMIFGYSSKPIADIVVLGTVNRVLGRTDNNSYILKDEYGRSLNIDVEDRVYITKAKWAYTTAYGYWTEEYRVKVVRNNEVIFNDAYYDNY